MRKTEFFRTALLVTVLVILTAPALGDTNYTANSTNVEIGNQVENNLSDTEQRDGVNWKVQEEDTSGVIDILGEDNLEVDVDFDQVSEENKITKITFIHEGKTTGETFDWRIFNYNTGSYENVSFSVDKNSLDYDAYSICETGECNKFDDPLNYISSNGLTETRFVDTDQSSGTQDNMSLNFQAVEITTDDTPPDIRNVSQNYSIITNDTSNLLEAEGYDNFNLSHAVLETNETGNFENKTSSYGSPEAYYTQQNWNETSFEWKNGSIEEEKTVQWRIWYNDTSGNFNATEANSFIVRPNINYSKNISVSFNYTTLTERNFTGNRELSQTISTADNQTRILDLNRSKRETINYSETPNRSQNFKKNQKTSLKADNIQPRNTDNSRAFITGASLSDPGARLSGVERIFSQAISVDPQNFRFYEGIREQINKLKYSDTVSREGLFQRILKQTYTVSNNGVRRFVGDRLLTQSIDYSDNQKISSVLERNFNQALALGEISTNTVFNFREVSDRLNINQVYTRNTQTARIFSETADFNSNFIRSNTLQRAFEDIYSQDPDEARIFTGARIVRQTLTGNTQNFRSLTQLRLDETITGFLDDQTRRSILQRSAPVVDILQSDRSSRSLLSLRIQDASFGILTPQSRTFTGARLLAESFLTADDQISASSLTRTDETTFSLTGGFARTYSGSRLFSNTFSAIISASRTGETEREEGFSTEIGSTETRTSFLERIDIASANYDTASLRVRNLIRDVFVQVRPDSQTTRTKRFLRIQKNSLDILTLEEDIFKGERALAETLQTADNQVSASKLGRIYETPASITGSFRRSFTGSRFIQSAFFKDSDTTRKGNVERLDTFNTELGQATSKTVLNLRDQLEELSLKDGITRETTASRLFQQKITSNNQETITSKLARATGQILLPGTSTTRTTSTNRLDTVTTAYSTVSIRISDILRNQVLQIKSESQTTRDIAVSRARDTGLGIIAPQSRSFTGTRILTENFFTEDSQLSDSNLKRTDLTTAAFTGSFTRSFAGSRIISDIFSQDSETSRALQNLRENSLNTAIGSETTRTVINLRDRLESFTIKSETNRQVSAARILQQEITSENQEAITSNLARTTSQILLSGTTTTRTTSTNRLDTATATYSSVTVRMTDILRNEILQIKPEPQTTRNTAVNRLQGADIGILTTATKSFSGIRTLTETFQTNENQITLSNLIRTDETTNAFTESLTRSFTGSRLFTDIFSIDSETGRTSNVDRENTLETTVNQKVSRTVIKLKQQLESFSMKGEELGQPNFLRLLEQQIDSESQETVTSNLARTATEALLPGTRTERITTLERRETVPAVYSTTTLRITDIFRNEILQINPKTQATGFPAFFKTVTESFTAGNTEVRTVLNQRLSQLSVDGTLLDTRNTLNLRSAAETLVSGTETVSAESALNRLLESGIATGTTESRILSQQRILDTQATVASNAFSVLDLHRIVTHSYISTDKAFYSASLGRTVLHDLSLTQNIETQSALARLNVETFTGISTPVRILDLNRDEQLEIDSEAEILTSSILSRLNAENLAIQELSSSEPDLNRAISEIVSGAESITTERQIWRSRNLGLETLTLADRVTVLQRATAEVIDGNFATSQTFYLNRLLNNRLDIAESDSRSLLQGRFTELNSGINQNIETASAVSRLRETAVGTTTSISVVSNLDRIIDSNFEYIEEESTTLRVYSIVSQPVGAQFDQTVSSELQRLLGQDLSIGKRFKRTVSVKRILDSGFQATSLELRGLSAFRVTQTDIKVDVIAGSVRAVDRNMVELITGTASENRGTSGFREITETVGPEINNIAESELERILNTEARLEYQTSSISALGRTVANGLGLTRSETTQGLYSRSLEKILYTDSSIETAAELDRVFTQGLFQDDQTLSLSILGRNNEELVDISSATDRSILTSRFTASTLTYGTLFNSEQTVARSVNQELLKTSDAPRVYSPFRITGTSVGFNEYVDPGFRVFEAVINTGLGFNQDNTRTVSVLRAVSEEYSHNSIIDSLLDLLDRSSDSGSGGSSGGGGGGGTIIDPIEDKEQAELSFADKKLSIKIKPGETSEAELELENTGNKDALTKIDVERLSVETVDAVTLEQSEINVPAESSVKTGLNIVVPEYLSDENLTNRVLERSVQASANNSSARIPVNILVESKEEELLDVRMELSENTVTESENTDYSLEIFNLGQSGRVDIELFTTVRNSTGQIVHEEKEELAVQTSASIVRNLDLDLPPGTYRIETKASYSGKEASSFSTLEVREEDNLTDSIPVGEIMLAALALLIVSSVADFLRRKRRYDKLAQSKVEEIKEYSKKQDIDFSEILKKESQKEQEIPVSVVDSETETGSTETVQKTEKEESRPPVKISDVDREKDREETPARISSSETEKEVSTDDEVFVCDECNQVFDSERDLQKHKQTVKDGQENGEAFICDECNQVFDSERDLQKHKQTVNTEKKKLREEEKVEELRDQMMELEKNIMEIKTQQEKEKRKLEDKREREDGTEEKINNLKDKLEQLEDRKQGLEADVLAEKMKKKTLREDLKEIKSKLESLDDNLDNL